MCAENGIVHYGLRKGDNVEVPRPHVMKRVRHASRPELLTPRRSTCSHRLAYEERGADGRIEPDEQLIADFKIAAAKRDSRTVGAELHLPERR